MRPLLSIVVLLIVGSSAAAVGSASAVDWRVNVHEVCSFKLLPGAGVALTTKLTIHNARGGRSASVRVTPGWNVGRMYPKAETALLVQLGPGQIVRRAVTRRISSVPRLRDKLKAEGINCASTYTYEVP